MSKQEAYAALVQARKACSSCQGLVNPSRSCGGEYDCDQIGAWSAWQGNLDARVMVIGQDWGDERSFIADRGCDSPSSPTNQALIRLMAAIGMSIGSPAQHGNGTAFFTNAILCLKDGGLQSKVEDQWFANCGKQFLLPLIQLVHPRVVVTLGEAAYRCIEREYRLPKAGFRQAVEMPRGAIIEDGVRLFPRYHCGRRIQNTHRKMDQQIEDWKRIRPFLDG